VALKQAMGVPEPVFTLTVGCLPCALPNPTTTPPEILLPPRREISGCLKNLTARGLF